MFINAWKYLLKRAYINLLEHVVIAISWIFTSEQVFNAITGIQIYKFLQNVECELNLTLSLT
jgi:hypothetical protein